MARKKKHSGKRGGMKIHLATVAGFAPGIANLTRAYSQKIHGQESGLGNLSVEASRIYLGIDSRIGADPKFNFGWMMEGTVPIILGVMISRLVGRFVNPKLARTGLPIRI